MRLFVAVWPPPAVIAQLAGIERPPLSGARWTTEDQWHVTLRFLGEVGADDVEVGKMALGRLASSRPLGPITAVAGPAVSRLGPTVLCVPVAGLEGLAAEVSLLTAGIGLPVGDRPFRGHLTIARAKGRRSLPAWPVPVSAAWVVREVTLVASHLHSEGARYDTISRVLLGPA